jgi:hypothetical protein
MRVLRVLLTTNEWCEFTVVGVMRHRASETQQISLEVTNRPPSDMNRSVRPGSCVCVQCDLCRPFSAITMRRALLLLSSLVALVLVVGARSMPTALRVAGASIFDRLDDGRSLPPAVDAPAATGKVFVHQRGIDLLQSVVNTVLESDLRNATLPDDTIPFVGGHVDLTTMVIQNVEFTAQQVGLQPPNQVRPIIHSHDRLSERHGPSARHPPRIHSIVRATHEPLRPGCVMRVCAC